MSEVIINLLGNNLLSHNGTVDTKSLCESKKYLGLYYSAHWCSSCIAFTPELIKLYTLLNDPDRNENFEIIYVSSDRDEKQFKEQFNLMPWLALPFTDRSREMELARYYRVQSIPALIIIDSQSSNVINSYGRACVMDDPLGHFFPWKMREPLEVLNESVLVSSSSSNIAFKSISSHVKGLYFSAYWKITCPLDGLEEMTSDHLCSCLGFTDVAVRNSAEDDFCFILEYCAARLKLMVEKPRSGCPPCRAFTPLLIKLYEKLKSIGQKFEVIFISSDRSEESFNKYFSTMPWLAVPYSEDKRRKELAHLYGVGGIPCLIILDENNSIITKEGRLEVNEDPDGEDFPWKPKLVDELGEKHISKLNEEPCLIYFTICEDKELELAHYALLPVSEEYQARVKRASAEETTIPKLNFFYAGDADICDSVRDIIGFRDEFPLLIILDIPNGKKYIHEKKDPITSDVIGKFVRDFISHKLTPCAISK